MYVVYRIEFGWETFVHEAPTHEAAQAYVRACVPDTGMAPGVSHRIVKP